MIHKHTCEVKGLKEVSAASKVREKAFKNIKNPNSYIAAHLFFVFRVCSKDVLEKKWIFRSIIICRIFLRTMDKAKFSP